PVTSSAVYTASFGVAVSGLSSSNFSLTATGGVTGTIGTPTTSNGGLTWSVPVNSITGNGTLRLNMGNSTGLTPGVNNIPFAGTTLTVSNPTGSMTAQIVGNDLVITDANGTKNNDWTVSNNGSGSTVITDPNEQFTGAPAGGTLSNGNKTLTIGTGAFSGM